MVEAYLNGSSDVTFYDLDIYNSPIIKCRRIISNYVGMAPGFLIHVHTSSLFCSIEEQCYLWYHFIIEHHMCICLYDFKHAVQNHNSNGLIQWGYWTFSHCKAREYNIYTPKVFVIMASYKRFFQGNQFRFIFPFSSYHHGSYDILVSTMHNKSKMFPS